MKMPTTCCAADCLSGYVQDPQLPISFYSFPKDRARKREWVIKVNRFDPKTKKLWQPKPSNKLCSLHFEESCFTFKTRFCRENGISCIPVLEDFAVPTLFSYNEESRKRTAVLSERRSAYSKRRAQKQMLEELLATQEACDQTKKPDTVIVPVECVDVISTLDAPTPVPPEKGTIVQTSLNPILTALREHDQTKETCSVLVPVGCVDVTSMSAAPTLVPQEKGIIMQTNLNPMLAALRECGRTKETHSVGCSDVTSTSAAPTPVPVVQTSLNLLSDIEKETCASVQASSKPDAKKSSSCQKYNRPRITERIKVRISPNHPYKDVFFHDPFLEELERGNPVSGTETSTSCEQPCDTASKRLTVVMAEPQEIYANVWAIEAGSSCARTSDLCRRKNFLDERGQHQKWSCMDSKHFKEFWCDATVKPDIDHVQEENCSVKHSHHDAHIALQESCGGKRMARAEHLTLDQTSHQEDSEKEPTSHLHVEITVGGSLQELKYKRGIQARRVSEHSRLSKPGAQKQSHVNVIKCDFVEKEFEDLETAFSSGIVASTDNHNCESKTDSGVCPTGLYPYPTGLYPNLHYVQLKRKLYSPTTDCAKVISDVSSILTLLS